MSGVPKPYTDIRNEGPGSTDVQTLLNIIHANVMRESKNDFKQSTELN